ncbi:hypothetical protein L195_g011587 [Trifolium pratense]|uniref:Uncharacterized protein n=1 Tax=Trifolium pratense TaxID=57577 RepID=A0A2K3PHY5_TRIPR|nr:hypothetical protein L195_g011587 [Trifolium pratense]
MELFVMLWLWRMQNLIIKLLGKLIENLIQRCVVESLPFEINDLPNVCSMVDPYSDSLKDADADAVVHVDVMQ